MNTIPFLHCFVAALLITTGVTMGASELPPLPTEYEADEIAREEATLSEEKRLQHPIHTVDWEVLQQKTSPLEDGKRTLVLRRVAPPELPEANEETTSSSYSDEDLALMEEYELTPWEFTYLQRYEGREHRVLSLSATVFNREITRIRWRHEGEEYTAWSTIDFNHLRGVRQFETDDKVYSLNMGIGEESTQDGRSSVDLPDLSSVTPGQAEYFVETDDPDLLENDALFAPLDVLHVYYERNAELLAWEYERRKILNAARKRYREAHPPEPSDTVIHFWRKGSPRQ